MALQNGSLVKHRMRVTLQGGAQDVDTGLRTKVQAYKPDPPLNGSQLNQIASRVMVIPLAPIDNWAGVTHEEPFIDAATQTVHVLFNLPNEGPIEINVLFDAVHTLEGPVSCDTYMDNPPPPPP